MSADEAAHRRRFAAVLRTQTPDLAEACLLMGTEADPDVTPEAGLAELDRLATLVAHEVRETKAGEDPESLRAVLALVLGSRAGFAGTPADYGDLRASLLHEVLRRRRGLPIMLSVVWIEVGRRAGLPVYGVALPGHFVVGIGDPDGDFVLADPFRSGDVLPVRAALAIAAEAAGGGPGDPLLLQPAPAPTIVLRILNNIRAWAQRPEHGPLHAWTRRWAVELSLLLPRHPAALRREYGLLLAQTGEFAAAAAELDAYAELIGGIDAELAQTVRQEASAARARLN